MKYSFYNIVRDYQGQKVLYNSFTEHVIAINDEIASLIEKTKNNTELLKTLHPDFYTILSKMGFLVNEQKDEIQTYSAILREEDQKENWRSYNLIINPTLDCNLRCWYCYEQHLAGSIMSENIIARVQKLINGIVTSQQLDFFDLGFFGGEPLMKLREVVFPLMMYSKKLCDKHQVQFTTHFTSNALLLTHAVVDLILANEIDVRLQVPFDGNEYFHNRIKKASNEINSYRTTLDNILYAISKNIPVVVRCNCSEQNIDSFVNLIDEFRNVDNKELVVFSVQRIWQEKNSLKQREKEKKLYEHIFQAGFNKFASAISPVKCYADRENGVVINYNGDVYKCTANDFIPERKEGFLDEKGVINYTPHHKKRLEVKYNLKECVQCNIYPICDMCTQYKLGRLINGKMRESCSEALKQEILDRRLTSLINTYVQN